jgi:hypothetical protein
VNCCSRVRADAEAPAVDAIKGIGSKMSAALRCMQKVHRFQARSQQMMMMHSRYALVVKAPTSVAAHPLPCTLTAGCKEHKQPRTDSEAAWGHPCRRAF